MVGWCFPGGGDSWFFRSRVLRRWWSTFLCTFRCWRYHQCWFVRWWIFQGELRWLRFIVCRFLDRIWTWSKCWLLEVATVWVFDSTCDYYRVGRVIDLVLWFWMRMSWDVRCRNQLTCFRIVGVWNLLECYSRELIQGWQSSESFRSKTMHRDKVDSGVAVEPKRKGDLLQRMWGLPCYIITLDGDYWFKIRFLGSNIIW